MTNIDQKIEQLARDAFQSGMAFQAHGSDGFMFKSNVEVADALRSFALSLRKEVIGECREALPVEKDTGIKMYPDKRTKEMRYLHGNSPSSVCIGCGQKKKAEEQGFNACCLQSLSALEELMKK